MVIASAAVVFALAGPAAPSNGRIDQFIFHIPGTIPADWFVAAAPAGSDSNACTSAGAPCATLSGVHGKSIQAGDIIEIAAGSYSGLTITKSGTAGNPITWRGHSGTCPTVVNSDPNSRGSRPDPTVTTTSEITISASYVTIDCIKNTSGGYSSSGSSRSNIIISNSVITCSGSGGCGSFDFQSSGVNHVTLTKNYTFQASESGSLAAAMMIDGNDFTVTDNEFERSREDAGDGDDINFWGLRHHYENNYMHGKVFTDNTGAHADCWQTYCLSGSCPVQDITITRNTCFHSDEHIIASNTGGLATDMQNWTITNNILAYPRLSGGGIGGGGFGGQLNVLFYHNIMYQDFTDCTRGDAVTGTVVSRNNIGGNMSQGGPCTVTNSNNISVVAANLIDAAGGNFHIQASSTNAIDAGMTGLGVSVDRDNVSRDASPDIGAYEYIGGTVFLRPLHEPWFALSLRMRGK